MAINVAEKEQELSESIACLANSCTQSQAALANIQAKESTAAGIVDGITDESIVAAILQNISKLRLTSTADVSETSIDHALQIGDATTWLKMDTNKLMIKKADGSFVAVPWEDVIQKEDFTYKTYNNSSPPVAWIYNANIRGDTNITLNTMNAYCYRFDRAAFITLNFEIGGFTIVPSSDSAISFRLDMGAIAQAGGFFNRVASGNIGTAYCDLAADGGDFPRVPFYCSVASYTSSLPNQVYLHNGDMTQLAAATVDATKMLCRVHFWVNVED